MPPPMSNRVKEYGTVGCTKDNVGKGKRIIIVDCITENGPVPGDLWIFSAGSKSQKEKQEISFEETAVTIEKAKETVHAVEEQDSEPKNVLSTSCMIKIFRGAGVVTPSKPPPPYEQLLPLPTPVL